MFLHPQTMGSRSYFEESWCGFQGHQPTIMPSLYYRLKSEKKLLTYHKPNQSNQAIHQEPYIQLANLNGLGECKLSREGYNLQFVTQKPMHQLRPYPNASRQAIFPLPHSKGQKRLPLQGQSSSV